DRSGHLGSERALAALLRQLGIPQQALPETAEEQEIRYRMELYSRAARGLPVLIVVDDASETATVLPLIPAHPKHRLLITSRHTMASLPTARRLNLGELGPDAAADLISNVLERA